MATSGSSDPPLLEIIESRMDILGKVNSDATVAIETEAGMKPFYIFCSLTLRLDEYICPYSRNDAQYFR